MRKQAHGVGLNCCFATILTVSFGSPTSEAADQEHQATLTFPTTAVPPYFTACVSRDTFQSTDVAMW